MRLSIPTTGAIATATYAVVYATLHSWLASQRVKRWSRQHFGPRADCWYRLFFNIVGVVTLLPVAGLLLLPDQVLYVIPTPWRHLTIAAQMGTLVSILYGVWITDVWHFLGIRQLFQVNPRGCSQRQPPLAVFGLYRWVRHPVYLLSIVLIWLTSTMTVNLFALFAVITLYLYIGTFFEEQRLLDEFGEAYARYQAQVPRLFPWRGPVDVSLTDPPQSISSETD